VLLSAVKGQTTFGGGIKKLGLKYQNELAATENKTCTTPGNTLPGTDKWAKTAVTAAEGKCGGKYGIDGSLVHSFWDTTRNKCRPKWDYYCKTSNNGKVLEGGNVDHGFTEFIPSEARCWLKKGGTEPKPKPSTDTTDYCDGGPTPPLINDTKNKRCILPKGYQCSGYDKSNGNWVSNFRSGGQTHCKDAILEFQAPGQRKYSCWKAGDNYLNDCPELKSNNTTTGGGGSCPKYSIPKEGSPGYCQVDVPAKGHAITCYSPGKKDTYRGNDTFLAKEGSTCESKVLTCANNSKFAILDGFQCKVAPAPSGWRNECTHKVTKEKKWSTSPGFPANDNNWVCTGTKIPPGKGPL
jgi:hypothetical protein